ncbi:MAG TPA: hypothetical protein DDZ80_31960 [Cyanobacteria bacterium UBA8803]|nr:hypothetical protein [Cyanobacteria bacterium UBA9273]HBL62824.1 hypothetical protein [Cyanobacteria bacterium UBA8803]
MKGKARNGRRLSGWLGQVAMAGLLAVVPTPTVGQTNPNPSAPQQLVQGESLQPATVNGRLDSSSQTLKDDNTYFNVHTYVRMLHHYRIVGS